MNDYCDQYHWRVEENQQQHSLTVRLDRFPESAARMMLLSAFTRSYSIPWNVMVVDVGRKNNLLNAIVKLVSVDLFPHIPYHIQENKVLLQRDDILQWNNGKDAK